MSNTMHSNHNRKGRSLFQRALEFIRSTLTFRLQWIQLRRRGETPNYLYLKGGATDRNYSDKSFSTISTVKPSKVEASIESVPEPDLDELSELSPISVKKRDVEDFAATGQNLVSEDSAHGAEDGCVSPGPVAMEQIETSLPILVGADDKHQPFFESVFPGGNNPEIIKDATGETLECCTEQLQEAATVPEAPEEESAHPKGPEEIVTASKKLRKNPPAQGLGQDRRDQMPLPFE